MSGRSPDEASSRAWVPLRAGWQIGLVLAGVGVIAALVARCQPEKVAAACMAIGPGVLLIIAGPLLGHVWHAWGWHVLVPRRERLGLRRFLRLYLASQAINDLSVGLGGEAAKAMLQAPARRRAAVPPIALDNLARLLAVAVFLLLSALAFVLLRPGEASWAWRLIVVAVVLTAATTAVVLTLMLVARRARWAAVVRQAGAALAERPWRFGASVALHVVGKSMTVAEIAIGLALLGISSAALAVGLGAASVGVGLAAWFVPGQIGVQEGSLVSIGQHLGAPAAAIMALALLRRVRSVVWTLAGLAVSRRLIRERLGAPPPPPLRAAPTGAERASSGLS